MDQTLGLPAGTLQGEEQLEELENWDSMALITLVALAESKNAVRITPSQIVNCTTVADFLALSGATDGSC